MEAILFDIDGTLLQSDASDDTFYLAAVRDVLGNVNLRSSWAMYSQFSAAGILDEILNDNAIEATPGLVAAVKAHFIASIRCHVSEHGSFPEVPGARAFVRRLQNSTSYRIAYATGGWRGSALLKLSAADFPVQGVPLSTSDDHFERQEIMLHALRQLDGAFDRVTYYGDGHWDAVAARALGWHFVHVGKKLGGLTKFEQSVA